MKSFGALVFVIATGLSIARAFPIDITRSSMRISNESEFVLENVRLSNQQTPMWGRFQWNPQTNSFVLVDFAPMSQTPVGRWDMSFDIDCDGNRGRTTWTLNADNTCVSGENRPCRWTIANNMFTLEYLSGGRTVYIARYNGGGAMSGTFSSPNSTVRGCWTATKMQFASFVGSTPDPRARRDSSGQPVP